MADLAAAIGLPREEIAKIWAEVQRNGERLRNCRSHTFEPVGEKKTLNQKYRCVNCGGTVDGVAYHWYEEGHCHALLKE